MLRTRHQALILTAVFLALLVALNADLFTQPIVEISDFAANSLLVQQAKHFHLMTGHYSRWHFHHPGPAFLYLFALGEFLFHDMLHVVPAPFNGQLLITIIFNAALLYAALHIFQRHARLPVAAALLAVMAVTLMVNTGIRPSSMLLSNWMPDILILPFLVFAVSAASVLAGESRDLVWMAFSGMLLIHAHIAQFLFVGVIGGTVVLWFLIRAQRDGQLRALVSSRWRHLATAAGIVLLLAIPPLLEIALHRPNNLDAVLAYMHRFGGAKNNAGMSLGFLACLFLFIGTPNVAVTKGPAGILAMGLSRPAVAVYWAAMAALLMAAILVQRRTAQERQPPFLRYLMGVAGASLLLFVYWGTRINGGLYPFNGMFVYALQLIAWFILLSWIAPLVDGRAAGIASFAAMACLLGVGIGERRALHWYVPRSPEVLQAAEAAPSSPFGTLAISFEGADWPWAAGVANSMQRLGKPFCVSATWGFMFSRKNVCRDVLRADKLRLTTRPARCETPCRWVYRGQAFGLSRYPAQPVTLPLEVGAGQSMDIERIGFDPYSQDPRLLQNRSSIRFWLAPELPPALCFQMALTGFVLPGGHTQVSVNGLRVGAVWNNELNTVLWRVPRASLQPGKVNWISLDTGKDAGGRADPRDFGYAFVKLVLRAAPRPESCPPGPGEP
jgi:hypothetical protein